VPVDCGEWQFDGCQGWGYGADDEQALLGCAHDETSGSYPENEACSSYNQSFDEETSSNADQQTRPRAWSSKSGDSVGSATRGRFVRHHVVPKKTNFVKSYYEESSDVTTLMIRNIPNKCTQQMLIKELDSLGFKGEYDFVYLPMDTFTRLNVGYGFVNFVTVGAASECTRKLSAHCFEHAPQGKCVSVSPAHMQGLESNVQHYRNKAVQNSHLAGDRPLILAGKYC